MKRQSTKSMFTVTVGVRVTVLTTVTVEDLQLWTGTMMKLKITVLDVILVHGGTRIACILISTDITISRLLLEDGME